MANEHQPTQNWMRMARLYQRFANDFTGLDFGDEAAAAMYAKETFGINEPRSDNGFAVGKKFMDVQIKMWREDIAFGLLFRDELYGCELGNGGYPQWFIDSVTSGVRQQPRLPKAA